MKRRSFLQFIGLAPAAGALPAAKAAEEVKKAAPTPRHSFCSRGCASSPQCAPDECVFRSWDTHQ